MSTALKTYRVTIVETILHTADIEGVTWRDAERKANALWRDEGPDAFTATTLGRCEATSGFEVHS